MSNQAVFRWTFVVMLAIGILATWCAWESGVVYGYCEGKFGPDIDVVFTGPLGITGECELTPAIPAERVVAP